MTPPHRGYWLCQAAFWGGYALAQIYVAVGILHVPAPIAAPELLAIYAFGLAASHGLRGQIKRRGWDTLRAGPLAPRVALAALVPAVPLGLAMSLSHVAHLQSADAPVFVGLSVGPMTDAPLHVINGWALFVVWQVIYFVVIGARKRRAAELHQAQLGRALQAAELRLLKSQLNPHFLFNALNTVRALIADDPARAQDAVTQLARTLRYTLSSNQDELVTLEQEMSIVDDYLALESLRLSERLRIERSVSPGAARARIPVMLLQTLVENAIKHGVAELPSGGVLRIDARVDGGSLRIEVENPRPAAAAAGGDGIGLRNARERLRLLFGEAASLALDLSAPGRALAQVRIPGAA